MQILNNASQETLQEYPCEYQFKAFGCAKPESNFAALVHETINEIVPIEVDALQHRHSGNGAYLCVTVVIYLDNEQQRQNIYQALQQLEGLKYLL
ncbi:MAG: DUF493 domain-containing protein [Desulfuromonas sp.]|nr:DUF493 domain-containing protein [Desulfuromonas sp.]